MKKKLSVFIALILSLNVTVFPGIFNSTALAASGPHDFSVSFDQKLTEGRINAIPIRETADNVGGSNAFIKWKTSDKSSGRFLLQYPVEDGVMAQLTLDIASTQGTVTYAEYDATSSPIPQGQCEVYPTPKYPLPNGMFFVYGRGTQASDGYVDYIIHPNIGDITDANSVVTNPAPVVPTFRIQKGYGFSIEFNNKKVQFLWDGNNGDFYVMSDAFTQSIIYPVSLFYSATITPAPNYSTKTEMNILTGLDESAVTAKALAKGKEDISTKLDSTQGEKPAEPVNAIEVEIDVPKVWEESTKTFQFGSTTNDAIQLDLKLSNASGTTIQVIIDNVFNPGADSRVNPSSIGFYDNGTSGNPTISVDPALPMDKKIKFRIGELPYGQLYSAGVSFGINGTSAGKYALNGNTLPFGIFYTFLKYSVAYIGDKYYAVVEPYRGYLGYYRLLVHDHASVTVYSNGINSIYMPLSINFGSETEYEYQIQYCSQDTFRPEDVPVVDSQILKYKEGPESSTIGIPNNFEILSHRYIPEDENSTETYRAYRGKLKLEVRWEIGRAKVIQALADAAYANDVNSPLSLKYKLYYTTQPYALTPDGAPDASKIHLLTTIRMDISPSGTPNVYMVKYSEETEPGQNPVLNFEPDVENPRPFRGTGSNNNDMKVIPDTQDEIYRAYVQLDTKAFSKNIITNPVIGYEEIDFFYPNIYFMNAQPYEIRTKGNAMFENIENSVGSSLYDSMTLNDYSRLEPPPPQDLTPYDAITTNDANGNPTEVSMKIRWTASGEKIREYFENSQEYDEEDIYFNLYISQNEKPLKDLTMIERTLDRINSPNVVSIDFSVPPVANNGTIYFSTIGSGTGLKISDIELREHLREGKIVCIQNITPDATQFDEIRNEGHLIDFGFKLDGLDKNQKYYFSADMLTHFSTLDDPLIPTYKEKTENSLMTSIVAETSMADENKPSPEDKFPPAPELSKEEITLSSATILWNKITEPNMDTAKVKFEYEIIRVKADPLAPDLLDSRVDLKTFLDNAVKNTDKAGFKTSGDKLQELKGSAYTNTDPKDFIYGSEMDTIKLTDNTLSPNTLYFYYVRTVRMVGDAGKEKILYSVWSDISVTTTPIKPPINLKCERTEKEIRLDKQREFVISFDAPITDISKLGTDVHLEYIIQKSGEEWSPPYKMDSGALKNYYSESEISGYIHFKYVVRNMYGKDGWQPLDAGATYNIQVRLVDNVNKDASVYSNIAEARTDFDPDEYDDKYINDQWLQYLKENLMTLIKEYYWTAYDEDDFRGTAYIYRPDMFDELLTHSEGSVLELAKSDSYTTSYYLPATAVIAAHEANKGFKIISSDNTEIIISPRAFDLNYNDAFIDINYNINKDRSIRDYYVRITVTRTNISNYIEGYDPLSQQLNVSISTVGNKIDNKEFDNIILDLLLKEIAYQLSREKTIDEIKDMLDDKDPNEDLVKFVADIVETAKNNFAEDVHDELVDTVKTSYKVLVLAAPLLVRYINDKKNVAVKGYYSIDEKVWTLKEVINASGIYFMSVNTPGAFVFAGNKISLPGIEGVQGSEDITAIVIKYGLDDYLGKDTAFKLDAAVTNHMVAGVSARFMGAGKTADPIEFLKQKGYIVSARTAANASTKQETVALLMKVYEFKTNTKISSMRITNYNLTSGVKNLSSNYAQAVRAAYQTGLLTDKNMDAKSNLTVKEFLGLILKLKDRAKL